MIFSVSFRLFIVFSCWFVLVFPSIIIATYQPYTLSYLETLSSGGTAPYAPVYDNVRGDLYVGLNSNTLRKYTGGTGTPTTVVSTCNARPFISPVNPNDMVIACNGQGTIKYVDLSVGFGTVVSLTGGTPWKAAFASNGDLFMTATSNTILKWTRSGGFSGAGTAVSNGGTCQGAVGISIFLSNNNVYAACATNNAIKVSTGAGTGAWTALSGTCSTNEVEVQQSTGDVFAACATDATHPLRKWVAGTGVGIDFESPTCTNIQGIHIAFNGDIFISCQNENSVVRFINGNSPGVALGTSCGGAAGLIATPVALPKLFCTAISANQIIVFSSAAVVGDPQFIGFHSQRYQVHGSPNRVYSIITAKEMQFNARFAFIGKGKTHLKKKQMKLYQKRSDQNNDNDNNNNYNNNNGIEKYQSNTTINSIVSTQSWTHSGNYLSSAIIKIRSIINNNNNILTLFLQTGPWETGFKTVTINGQPLNIGEEIKINNNKNNCRSPSIFYRSSHSIEVSSGRFLLLLTNADEFLNVDGAQFNQGGCGEAKIEVTNDNHKKKEEEEDDEAVMNKLSVHGLLGHTAQLISKADNDSNHHDHHHYRNNNNNDDDDDTMNTNKTDDWHVPGLIEDYEEENNQLEGDRFTVNKF